MKHTAGPWQVIINPDEHPSVVSDVPSSYICHVGPYPNDLANARLIAQAPELREFVELIARMKTYQENKWEDPGQVRRDLDDLIVSARKLIGRAT